MKIQFRIQERKFSSNVIEKGVYNEEKDKWTWSVYICPTCPKAEGDEVAASMLELLNS